MNRASFAAFASWILLLPAADTAAQTRPVPQRLSLDEAVRLAADRNPQAAAARALVEIAEANRVDARLRPNPAVSVESESYPLFQSPRPAFVDGQELTIRFDQEFETAGRRRLRTEAAAAGVSAANLTARDRFRQLERAVRRAYLQLALAQADADVARTSLQEIDRVLTVGRERVNVGEAPRSEVSRLEVERLRFAEDAFSADLALRNARAALLTLLGASDLTQAIEAADPLIPPSGSAVVAISAAASAPPPKPLGIDLRPDLLAAREELRRAETETRLQRALRSPNVTVGGGYRRDFGTNAVVFGVTVPLPLWNRNQGGVARAAAEQQLAASNLATVELDVRLDIQQAVNAVETNRARAEYIERQILASARESREVVSESYRLGAADLIDFLDAQRAFRDTLRTYNRALFDYRVSVFELEAARGLTSIQ
jgi:cobalt-zinc-cadmium efflux system outer membrane protein